MNLFVNKLIKKDDPYENGFFPKIPNFKKEGSAFILTDGINDDIKVNEHTTAKEIRQGKYKRLVEISMSPYIKELRFTSASKETSYSFDVYVKAVIQVNNALKFYNNKNIDVDAYFDNLFSLDVRNITRGYSILDYAGMDEKLKDKLVSINTLDESIGFKYQISVVAAEPGKEAQDYVRQHDTQHLGARLKQNARELSSSVAMTYEQALRTEVIEGKLSEAEAIIKIQEYENANFDEKIKRVEELRERGFVTDVEANSILKPLLLGQTKLGQAEQQNSPETDDSVVINGFY